MPEDGRSFRFCSGCGYRIISEADLCPYCGREQPLKNVGVPILPPEESPARKKRSRSRERGIFGRRSREEKAVPEAASAVQPALAPAADTVEPSADETAARPAKEKRGLFGRRRKERAAEAEQLTERLELPPELIAGEPAAAPTKPEPPAAKPEPDIVRPPEPVLGKGPVADAPAAGADRPAVESVMAPIPSAAPSIVKPTLAPPAARPNPAQHAALPGAGAEEKGTGPAFAAESWESAFSGREPRIRPARPVISPTAEAGAAVAREEREEVPSPVVSEPLPRPAEEEAREDRREQEIETELPAAPAFDWGRERKRRPFSVEPHPDEGPSGIAGGLEESIPESESPLQAPDEPEAAEASRPARRGFLAGRRKERAARPASRVEPMEEQPVKAEEPAAEEVAEQPQPEETGASEKKARRGFFHRRRGREEVSEQETMIIAPLEAEDSGSAAIGQPGPEEGTPTGTGLAAAEEPRDESEAIVDEAPERKRRLFGKRRKQAPEAPAAEEKKLAHEEFWGGPEVRGFGPEVDVKHADSLPEAEPGAAGMTAEAEAAEPENEVETGTAPAEPDEGQVVEESPEPSEDAFLRWVDESLLQNQPQAHATHVPPWSQHYRGPLMPPVMPQKPAVTRIAPPEPKEEKRQRHLFGFRRAGRDEENDAGPASRPLRRVEKKEEPDDRGAGLDKVRSGLAGLFAGRAAAEGGLEAALKGPEEPFQEEEPVKPASADDRAAARAAFWGRTAAAEVEKAAIVDKEAKPRRRLFGRAPKAEAEVPPPEPAEPKPPIDRDTPLWKVRRQPIVERQEDVEGRRLDEPFERTQTGRVEGPELGEGRTWPAREAGEAGNGAIPWHDGVSAEEEEELVAELKRRSLEKFVARFRLASEQAYQFILSLTYDERYSLDKDEFGEPLQRVDFGSEPLASWKAEAAPLPSSRPESEPMTAGPSRPQPYKPKKPIKQLKFWKWVKYAIVTGLILGIALPGSVIYLRSVLVNGCQERMLVIGRAEESYKTEKGTYTDIMDNLKPFLKDDYAKATVCPDSAKPYTATAINNLPSDYIVRCYTAGHTWTVQTGDNLK